MMCHPGGDFHVFLSDLPTAICQCGRQRIDGRPVYLCKPPWHVMIGNFCQCDLVRLRITKEEE